METPEPKVFGNWTASGLTALVKTTEAAFDRALSMLPRDVAQEIRDHGRAAVRAGDGRWGWLYWEHLACGLYFLADERAAGGVSIS